MSGRNIFLQWRIGLRSASSGSGLVASLAHPGGNSTGFTAFEFSLNAKLLDLLKEITPDVKRVAVVRDATVPAGSGGFASIHRPRHRHSEWS